MKIGIFPLVGDLLHAGHLHALEYAKQHCDYLIAALNVDPTVDNAAKNKPIETVYERWKRLRSCKYVDEIITYCGEEDLLRLLATTIYHIRFVGEDHVGGWTGDLYEARAGIEHCVIPRSHSESSSALRARIEKKKGEK